MIKCRTAIIKAVEMIRINFWRVNFLQILKESLSVYREAFCCIFSFNLLEYLKPGLDKSSPGLLFDLCWLDKL